MIAYDRVTDARKVDAQLMRTPGLRPKLHQRAVAVSLNDGPVGHRSQSTALRANDRTAVTPARSVAWFQSEWRINLS